MMVAMKGGCYLIHGFSIVVADHHHQDYTVTYDSFDFPPPLIKNPITCNRGTQPLFRILAIFFGTSISYIRLC